MNRIARVLALCAIAIAANTASAAALTESSINELLAAMDQSIQTRNPDAVGRLLSSDFSLTLEIKAYGQKQTTTLNKTDYLKMLRQAWSVASAYQYDRRNVKITISPGNSTATVSARIHETLTMQGQAISTVSTETATVKLIEGRVLMTGVSSTLQEPSAL